MEKDTQKGTLLQIVLIHDSALLMTLLMTGKSLVIHRRLYPETDSNVLTKELLQENLCYFTLKRHNNKFQHSFATSQKKIWTDVPQVSKKATQQQW